MKIACLNCGANLDFNPEMQECICEYCGKKFSKKDLEELEIRELDIRFNKKEYDEYKCASCGASLVTTNTNIVTNCVYCKSKNFIKEKFLKYDNPSKIIPYRISKEKAFSIFRKYIEKEFEGENIIIRKMLGVYIPFYYLKYKGIMDIDVIISRKISNSFRGIYLRQKMKRKEKFDIDVMKSSSNIISSLELNNLSGFNVSKAKEFNLGYLGDFYLETSEISLEESQDVSVIQCFKEYEKELVKDDIYVLNGTLNGEFENIEHEHIYAPMWIIKFKIKNKEETFVINGQSGEYISSYKEFKLVKQAFINVLPIIIIYMVFGISLEFSQNSSNIFPMKKFYYIILFSIYIIIFIIISIIYSCFMCKKIKKKSEIGIGMLHGNVIGRELICDFAVNIGDENTLSRRRKYQIIENGDIKKVVDTDELLSVSKDVDYR